MDVGFYLGELLMQQGEVTMPGLGIFSQVRMSAYYNENEALFYPPYNKVRFEPQPDITDEEFASYLAEKKGISLASAKYFIDKYIANLRQQAIVADVPLGNMGVFFTDKAELAFKPNDRLLDDSELYGYLPVNITKINTIPADVERAPIPELIYPPQPEQETITEEENTGSVEATELEGNIASTYDEGFMDLPEEEEYEEERRGPLRLIIIMLIIIAILAGGVFALYTYAPANFNKLQLQMQFWKKNQPVTPVKPKSDVILIPGIDSLHTDSIKTTLNDSAAKVTDTVNIKRFELISGKGYKTYPEAQAAVNKFRALGIKNAIIFAEIGPLVKVSVGTFKTLSESEAYKQQLIKEGTLTTDARTQEIINE